MEGTRVGRIAGFELRVHWSTLVIFGLIWWSLTSVQLPHQAPGAGDAAYVLAGLAAGVAFYLGLLAHEVSHAVVARRHGIGVRGLTLWMLGGLATLEGEPRTPGADLRIAAAGPAVSLAVAAVAAVVALVLDAAGAAELVVASVGWLAGINAILAVFNLIPAAPLDGGRVLRAALWAWRGDRTWAARTAGRAGEFFGYGLVGLGLLGLFVPGVGGLWFVVLGWFLINAARAEQLQAELRGALGDLPVAAIMSPAPVTAPADVTIAALLEEYVLRTRHSAFPLLDAEGRPAGLITLGRLRSVPPQRRAQVRAGEVACPMSEVVVASPDEAVVELVPRLTGCADGRALVIDGGRLVGIVSASDVTRAIDVGGLRPPTAALGGSAPPRR